MCMFLIDNKYKILYYFNLNYEIQFMIFRFILDFYLSPYNEHYGLMISDNIYNKVEKNRVCIILIEYFLKLN